MRAIPLLRAFVLAAAACAAPVHAADPPAAPADSIQPEVDAIAHEIEQLRGQPFKRPVHAEPQSPESYSEFVSRELDEQIPEVQRRHYGAIVRALGLYRGPDIDFSSMMTTVMTSQVGAYYDPEKQGFFVLMTGLPELMRGVMYSHELYHAMQDQYFDLSRYMESGRGTGIHSFNADTRLARSAVVEGEATYVMSLWMMQKMTHQQPTRDLMAKAVAMQSSMTVEQLQAALAQPQVAKMVGTEMQDAVKAAVEIPPFIMDSMMGVYLKGLGFVFAVHEGGWPAVEKLYTEYPPRSTEHILHPDKWLGREAPVTFDWPKFERVAALRDWELLDDDVLGEFQWRIVFREQGLAPQAESAAAGWGGDRYALFKRKDADATLLLMRTRWDNEAEAREFTEAYRRVLETKHADKPVPTRLEQKGNDVFIVEGGDEGSTDKLLKLVKRVKPNRG